MSISDRLEAMNFLNGLRLHGIHPTLENVRALLDRTGNPQLRFSSIQVVGSNGKGSTASILASILAANDEGLVGLYTSPHLSDLRERVLVQGQMLPVDSWLQVLDFTERSIRELGLPITFFEAITCAAFSLFERSGIQMAVLEAGMGGRWDATSVAIPLATVLTSVSLEHTQILGNTLVQILAEKIAVGREGRPFIAKLPDELLPEFQRHANTMGFIPILWGRDFSARWVSPETSLKRMFSYKGPSGTMELPVSLVADYQIGNIALALASLDVLGKLPKEETLAKALLQVVHPGRWEKISDSPQVYLDGAHNPEAAEVLAQTIKDAFGPDQKVIYLFGILEDKNWKQVLEHLVPSAESFFLTSPLSNRAVAPERLVQWLSSVNATLPKKSGPIEQVLGEAIERASSLSLPLVVAGSLYLVGEVRQRLTGLIPDFPVGEHSPEDNRPS